MVFVFSDIANMMLISLFFIARKNNVAIEITIKYEYTFSKIIAIKYLCFWLYYQELPYINS